MLLLKDHPIQLLMVSDRVPNKKCLKEYIEGALYCSGECVPDWSFAKKKGMGTLLLPALNVSTKDA